MLYFPQDQVVDFGRGGDGDMDAVCGRYVDVCEGDFVPCGRCQIPPREFSQSGNEERFLRGAFTLERGRE